MGKRCDASSWRDPVENPVTRNSTQSLCRFPPGTRPNTPSDLGLREAAFLSSWIQVLRFFSSFEQEPAAGFTLVVTNRVLVLF